MLRLRPAGSALLTAFYALAGSAFAQDGFQPPKAWSFANHITPILTFGGCNQSACHGSPKGKNGFKLSLYGSDPEADRETLLKGRVDLQNADSSLLLRKPTMQLAHGGGPRFKKDSQHYQMLRAWIAAGAPLGDPNAPKLARLDVQPGYKVLRDLKTTVPMSVTAIFSDGSRENVTSMAVYASNDEAILKASTKGVVTPQGGTGDAAIMVRYAGQFGAAVFGATTLTPPRAFPASGENIIDREVYAKLRDLNMLPSANCTDAEFIRRIYIDLLGVLPSAADVKQFLSSTAPDKRAILIDQVLERPEYADMQALLWADRLRSDSRFHRVGGVRSYYRWLREEFAANRPLDKFARAMLTARGTNFTVGPANYWGNYDKISTPIEVAIATGQVFMGVRIGCAQCHNHPFEKWTQSDFYSLAAVFSQVVEFHTKNSQEFDLRIDPDRAVIHPVTKQAAIPKALGGPVLDPEPGVDRRLAFAEWLTAKENPFFARAMANLIWKNLMGRGIVDPVDDMRETNPPTHPKLLDALARELAAHNFDQKYLIRLIANSKTYQHSSAANETNKFDGKYYSRAFPKRMMAEVYMDAIAQITGVPDEFPNWPEAKRAVQLPDNRMQSLFLEIFERSSRLVICDREQNVTVTQALHFVNGPEVQKKLTAADGRLTRWLESGKTDSELLDEMFLATVSRRPNAREKDRLLTRIGGASSRREAFEDVLWAMLNAREFVFNH